MNSENDLNRGWESQRKTYQQFVRTYDGIQDYQADKCFSKKKSCCFQN